MKKKIIITMGVCSILVIFLLQVNISKPIQPLILGTELVTAITAGVGS